MACNDLKMNQDESCWNPTLQPTKATHQEIHAKIFETPQIIDLCHCATHWVVRLFWASLGIPRHPWASLGVPTDAKASRGQASPDLVVRLRHHHLPFFCCLAEAGQHCEAKPRQQHQAGWNPVGVGKVWIRSHLFIQDHPSSTKGYPS